MRSPVALPLWCALSVVVSACGARPVPGTAPALTSSAVDATPTAPWQVNDLELPRALEILLHSELVTQVDTTTRRDSLASRLVVEWTPAGHGTGTQIRGTASAFGTRTSGADAFRTPVGLTVPFSFVADWQPPELPTIVGQRHPPCPDPQTALLDGWRDLAFTMPPRFSPGDRWRDSTSYTICRDGIPLAVSVIRTYRVIGLATTHDLPAVQIERIATRQLRGSGSQFGEPITITGDGESAVMLTLTLRGGIILDGAGTSTLRLQLDGRHRHQTLVQTSLLEVSVPKP